MSTQIVLGTIVLMGIFTVIYVIIYGGLGTTQLNDIDKDETNDKENIVYGDTNTVCSVSPPVCTNDDNCSEICGDQNFTCQTVSPSTKKCLPPNTLPNCEGEKILSYAQDDNSLTWECKCNWPTWVNGNCTVDDKLPGICENGPRDPTKMDPHVLCNGPRDRRPFKNGPRDCVPSPFLI